MQEGLCDQKAVSMIMRQICKERRCDVGIYRSHHITSFWWSSPSSCSASSSKGSSSSPCSATSLSFCGPGMVRSPGDTLAKRRCCCWFFQNSFSRSFFGAMAAQVEFYFSFFWRQHSVGEWIFIKTKTSVFKYSHFRQILEIFAEIKKNM